MFEYKCVVKSWDLSHSGCEVFVKAKYLCYIQRKVDTEDANYRFNSIWKATEQKDLKT